MISNLLLVAATIPAWAALNQPIHSVSGALQGTPGKNPVVTVFRGVPYAAPPVGDLRWRPPQPVHAWTSIRQANRFGDICMQNALRPGSFYQVEFYTSPEPMSEDCLYLNLWSTASAASEKRPVMQLDVLTGQVNRLSASYFAESSQLNYFLIHLNPVLTYPGMKFR